MYVGVEFQLARKNSLSRTSLKLCAQIRLKKMTREKNKIK